MKFTKEEIFSMNEKEFREKILLPLFDTMGFKDVYHYHGNIEEGKDIIFWKPDALGVREYYSVVVKTNKITGKATGKGSSKDVSFQVQQSFSMIFKDKIDGKDCSINIVWVVTNKDILPQARKNIRDIYKEKKIEFLDGEDIYKLYSQYLPDSPTKKILEDLKELDSISPHWSVGIQKTGNSVVFRPEPKHKYADQLEPLKTTLTIPSNLKINGISIQEIFSNPSLITKPIFFPKEMIHNFEASEFLQKAFDLGDIKNGLIIEHLIEPKKEILIKFVDYQSNEYLLDGIKLDFENRNEDSSILSNIKQNLAYIITFNTKKNNNKDLELSFTITVRQKGYNVTDTLRGYKLLEAASTGGVLFVIEKPTNKILINTPIQQTGKNELYKNLLEILESLNFIQLNTGVQITIPDREMTNEEIFQIKIISYIMRRNLFLGEDFLWWNVKINKSSINDFIKEIEINNFLSYYDIEDKNENIFGKVIPLGKVHLYSEAVTISEQEKEKIFQQIASGLELIDVTLSPFNNSLIYCLFENYLENGKELNEEKVRNIMKLMPENMKFRNNDN